MQLTLLALAFLIGLLGSAAVLLWLNDRITAWLCRDRRSPEQTVDDEAHFEARLLSPQWDDVAKITGGLPSLALQNLYSDRDLLLTRERSVRLESARPDQLDEEIISEFLPADQETLRDAWYWHLPAGSFPFARDISGDFLFVLMNADHKDSPVMHWFHDGGDVEMIAPSLNTFLQWCRRGQALDERN